MSTPRQTRGLSRVVCQDGAHPPLDVYPHLYTLGRARATGPGRARQAAQLRHPGQRAPVSVHLPESLLLTRMRRFKTTDARRAGPARGLRPAADTRALAGRARGAQPTG